MAAVKHTATELAPSTGRGYASILRTALIAIGVVGFTAGCGSTGPSQVPEPRGLIIHSGERLRPDRERMQDVHIRVSEQVDSIIVDPSFMITTSFQDGPVHPWDALELNPAGDSAEIQVQNTAFDASGAYRIYAHLHLMAAQNRLDRWLPEAIGGDEFELERAILEGVADTWLYQRSIFDAQPYGPLDELMFARESGYLDAYILTAQTDSFVEARRTWQSEEPGAAEEYREWFFRVFRREPPGMRGST